MNLVTAIDEMQDGLFRRELSDKKHWVRKTKALMEMQQEQLDMFTNQCLKKIRIYMK